MYGFIQKDELDSIADFYSNDARIDGNDAKLIGITEVKAYGTLFFGEL